MIDLDNTLADREAAVRSWITEFCAEHELTTDDADWIFRLDNDGYSTRRDVFEAIRGRAVLNASVDTLLGEYRARVIELIKLSPGASECLEGLRAAGHALAIVTNGSSKQQHAKIDRLGLAPMVDAVCVSGDLGIAKPDPRIFHHAMGLLGEPRWVGQRTTQAGSAWFVGDSAVHDIGGAQALGLRTVWLSRGRRWDPALPAPDLSINSLLELGDHRWFETTEDGADRRLR